MPGNNPLASGMAFMLGI